MFEVSNPLCILSIAMTLICGGFIYYHLKSKLTSVENDMSSIFNLVSSLNDEQKRIGNLVMYSLNNQSSITPTEGGSVEPSDVLAVEVDTMVSPPVISDMRITVSDDEQDTDPEDEESDDEESDNSDIEESNEQVRVAEITDANVTANLNKMKVGELKQYLEGLSVSKEDMSKAKRMKKKELVDFIEITIKTKVEADPVEEVEEVQEVEEEVAVEDVAVEEVAVEDVDTELSDEELDSDLFLTIDETDINQLNNDLSIMEDQIDTDDTSED